MERTRNGPFLLLVPALVVLPLAALVLWLSAWHWYQGDARAALTRRVADAAASAERLLDASVERQVQATRVLGTSPVAWLWVKFQGQRLTPSNRSHAQAALDEVSSYASLLPGATIYLASERTRAVYQSGAAVAALSPADPRDAWYTASLAAEGVVVSDDPRQVRTSMRVMNGPDLIGAVSCVGDVSRLAAGALAGADDERSFSFVLADREGSILLSRGPQVGTASTVFDLFDSAERARVRASMDLVARPSGMTVDAFSSHGQTMLTAVTRTEAPGWYLLVSAQMPSMPAGRTVAIAAVAAASLALIVAALAFIGLARARRVKSVLGTLTGQRDEAASISREASAAAARIRAVAVKLRERVADLARETSAGAEAARDTGVLVGQAEERSAELRARVADRVSLLTRLSTSAREASAATREAQVSAGTAGQRAAGAEEEVNRVITTASAVSFALENAAKAAGGSVDTAERARILALNTSLETSRPGGSRRLGAQAAEEMRRLAEEAARAAGELSGALAEARDNLRAVGRLAQEAGTSVHEAAARTQESSERMEASIRGFEDALAELEAANAGARGLEPRAADSDRARSAADGMARILDRIASLCGEISILAEETDLGEPSQQPQGEAEPAPSAGEGAET